MKITNLNILSLFTGLFCLNLICNICPSGLKAQSAESGSLKSANVKTFKFYDSQNKAVAFNDSMSYFVLLKNNRNCSQCFKEINHSMAKIKESVRLKLVVIGLADSVTLERKRTVAASRIQMPDFTDYWVTYNNGNKNIFDEFKTDYTPEILLINANSIIHIPYSEIFSYPGLNITPQTFNKINAFLKR